jgi:hypothetical protein
MPNKMEMPQQTSDCYGHMNSSCNEIIIPDNENRERETPRREKYVLASSPTTLES